MADVHGNPAEPGLQMPQMGNPGPATLPYPGGRDQAAGNPPVYAVDLGPIVDHPLDIVHPSYAGTLNTVQDPSAYTLDGNPGPSPLATPYYAGQQAPVHVHGDADAGGGNNIAATVGDAVTMAAGRWHNLESDVFKGAPVVGTVVHNEPNLSAYPQQQGSVIGDLVDFPPSPLDPGVGVGNTLPTAAFFDPTREYGGANGAPGYQGEAQ